MRLRNDPGHSSHGAKAAVEQALFLSDLRERPGLGRLLPSPRSAGWLKGIAPPSAGAPCGGSMIGPRNDEVCRESGQLATVVHLTRPAPL